MKFLVILAFVAILGSLGTALWYMMRGQSSGPDDARSKRMARALAARVGFSIMLFVLVLISYKMGWVQPTGLPTR